MTACSEVRLSSTFQEEPDILQANLLVREDEANYYRRPILLPKSQRLCMVFRHLAIPTIQHRRTCTFSNNRITKCIGSRRIFWTHHISTFSEHGSFLIISGAIHATVPANVILVLLSFHSRLGRHINLFPPDVHI